MTGFERAGGLAVFAAGAAVFFAVPGAAVLPPGYEDEIYCPPDFCLQAKGVADGFAGPRTAFVECVHQSDSSNVVEATAWGKKHGDEKREQLLQDGFHMTECTLRLPAPGDDAGSEWSAGPQHWACIVAALIGGWYFVSRASGGGSQQCAGGSATTSVETMRQRRLEALEKAAAAASARATADPSSVVSKPSEVVAAAPAEAKAAASQLEPQSDMQSDAPVAAKAQAGTSSSAAAGSAPAAAAPAPAKPKEAEGGFSPPATSATSKPVPAEIHVKGSLRGTPVSGAIGGLTADSTVGWLLQRTRDKFEPGADARIRLFHKGKELTKVDANLASVGVLAGDSVQVMFSAVAPAAATASAAAATSAAAAVAPPPPAAAKPSAASNTTPAVDPGSPFSVRAQGALPGQSAAAHTVEGLTQCTTTLELENRIRVAFGGDEYVRLRLFYMGREMKDPDMTLGTWRVSPGSTVQAMFAEGKGPAAPSGAAQAPTGSDAPPKLQPGDETADAVMAAASAVGCDPAAMFQMPGATAGEQPAGIPAGATAPAAAAAPAEDGPAEAWRALAELDSNLARATDPNEDAQARQAAAMLKQMLQTMTHGSNETLLKFAQSAVPDLAKIWAFEPTREHLMYILRAEEDGDVNTTD